MSAFILAAFIGVICVVLGITNFRGNISSVHSYHRDRVSEKDVSAFGKLMGIGMFIIGGGLILFGGLSAVQLLVGSGVWMLLGTIALVVGLVVGLAFSFFAMIKYNKGIF